jgi:hypothetical protein
MSDIDIDIDYKEKRREEKREEKTDNERDIETYLLVFGINTRRRGVEEALHTLAASSLGHVERDHDVVVQDRCVVALDETHASHIGSKVEHPLTTLTRLEAVLQRPKIMQVEFVAKLLLGNVDVALDIGNHQVVAFGL